MSRQAGVLPLGAFFLTSLFLFFRVCGGHGSV